MVRCLSKRLAAVMACVPACKTLADVGCDHGQAAIFAAQNGLAEKITASDIVEGPLSRARAAVAEAELEDKIRLVRCDGLSGLSPHECVIIAGMGGETIADIISRAEWTRDRKTTLVLQPMSKSHLLRAFLYENGFDIEAESFVRDGGRLYCVITARGGAKSTYAPYECYVSRASLSDPLCAEYIDTVIKWFGAELESKLLANDIGEKEANERRKILCALKERRAELCPV